MGRILIIPVFVLFYLNTSGQARVNFTGSNLPIIVIDVHDQEIVDDPKITADMGMIDNGPGQRNNIADAFTGYEGKIGIEIRGSSSQMFPKKPYGLELRDGDGDGVDATLLGMPEEEDWSLIATYNDKSLLRDALAYKIGRDLGRYAPRTRFCELVIKKDTVVEGTPTTTLGYKGIYMLTEKIKRDKYRVDINKLDPDEISGDNLTGGYILKIDKTTGDSGAGFDSKIKSVGSGKTIQFQYEEPAYDDVVTEQKTYIQQFINAFEAALNGPDYKDADKGYAKYINVDSFIDFLIVNEISRNVDGYRLSTFMYKDKDSKGGKLVMGPVWDFNLGFGNADYCSGQLTTGWAYDFNSVCRDDGSQIPFWWSRLLTDTAFQKRLGDRWTTLRSGKLSTSSLHAYVDSVASVLDDEAAARNFQAWSVLDEYVWPNYYVGKTYQDEVDWLKEWVEDRAAWLDEHMPKRAPKPDDPDPEEPEPPTTVTATSPEDTPLQFSVSPNPFADALTVRYTLRKPGTWSIVLIDPLGRRLSSVEARHDLAGTYEVVLSPSGLTGGIYYVQATSAVDAQRVVRKVIKR